MEIKELTELLATSSQSLNQSKFLPWWEDDFANCIYRYDIFKEEAVQNIEACVAECGKETLLAPVGSYGLTLFQLLVWHNFYDAVKKVLCDGRITKNEINETDHKGYGVTPLMLACCRGNLPLVQLLLEKGADDSLCDAKGRNSYHYLAYPRFEGLANGHSCMEKSLEQREAIARLLNSNINQKDQDGMSPLVLLLHKENTNCSWALAGVFLEKGAETDYISENGDTLLMLAIKNNHTTAALHLIEKCSSMINLENKEGMTPIQLATNSYNEGLCLALRDHGATQADANPRLDINNLSRITSNAFARVSENERDPLGIALYLAQKLITQVDTDDDDEMNHLLSILHNALTTDKKCQVLELCKKAGIDFTAPIHSGGTVTCLRDKCLSSGYGVAAIKKLMELGVDMDEAVIQGRTPANLVASLHKQTITFGKKDTYFEQAAEFFSRESIEQTDNQGTTALHHAARNGHVDMLKVMIEKGADVNLTEDAPAEPGNTPLHTACIYGRGEVVKLLIASGADDTLKNLNGETPAHLAVMKKKFGGDLRSQERAEMLKELKHLDAARNDGKTPLMLLQSLDINTNMELLPIFLDRGVDVNRTDNYGNTALILNTKEQCYKNAVKELIRAGADVNAADQAGNTALYYALKYGDQESARFLIKKGADYNRANNQGLTPMQVAVEKGYDTVLELMT